MRRIVIAAIACLAWTAGVAHAGSIGIGAFGGGNFPVVQEDTGNGPIYGIRAPINLVPLFAVEPYWASSSLGDKTLSLGGGLTATSQGFDVSSYGLNAMLTMGGPISFYPYAGVGATRLKRSGTDASFTSYDLGVGLGISPIPKLSLHLRGEFQAVVDNGASRKFANVTAGATWSLISLP